MTEKELEDYRDVVLTFLKQNECENALIIIEFKDRVYSRSFGKKGFLAYCSKLIDHGLNKLFDEWHTNPPQNKDSE